MSLFPASFVTASSPRDNPRARQDSASWTCDLLLVSSMRAALLISLVLCQGSLEFSLEQREAELRLIEDWQGEGSRRL